MYCNPLYASLEAISSIGLRATGWTTAVTAKEAYEKGIKEILAYHGVDKFYDSYIAFADYYRAGISIKWDHTAEPPSTVEMDMVNGYTGQLAKYAY